FRETAQCTVKVEQTLDGPGGSAIGQLQRDRDALPLAAALLRSALARLVDQRVAHRDGCEAHECMSVLARYLAGNEAQPGLVHELRGGCFGVRLTRYALGRDAMQLRVDRREQERGGLRVGGEVTPTAQQMGHGSGGRALSASVHSGP